MPPAPTRPSTAAARTQHSNEYSMYAIADGSACGQIPNTKICTRLAPVVRSASSGRGSTVSNWSASTRPRLPP